MTRDVEEALDKRPARVVAVPATRPSFRWLEQKVGEIAKEEKIDTTLSGTAKKKARAMLHNRIMYDGYECKRPHTAWTTSFVSLLYGWDVLVSLTVACISSRSCWPRPVKQGAR